MLFAKGILEQMEAFEEPQIRDASTNFLETGREIELECTMFEYETLQIKLACENQAIEAFKENNRQVTESLNTEFEILKEAAERSIGEKVKVFFKKIYEKLIVLAKRVRNWVMEKLKDTGKFIEEHKNSTAEGEVETCDLERAVKLVTFNGSGFKSLEPIIKKELEAAEKMFLIRLRTPKEQETLLDFDDFMKSNGFPSIFDSNSIGEYRYKVKDHIMGEKSNHKYSVKTLIGLLETLNSNFKDAFKIPMLMHANFKKLESEAEKTDQNSKYTARLNRITITLCAVYTQLVDSGRDLIYIIRNAISKIDKK